MSPVAAEKYGDRKKNHQWEPQVDLRSAKRSRRRLGTAHPTHLPALDSSKMLSNANLRRVTSQKNESLNCTAVEA